MEKHVPVPMEKDLEKHSEGPPNRFSFFSSQTQQVITSPTWDTLLPGHSLDQTISQEKAKGRPDPSHPLWWFDIRDASEEEVAQVSHALAIHPLTAEDIAMREVREKVDVFKNYYLISFQTLLSQGTNDERPHSPPSAVIYVLVFQYGVVTFSPSGCNHVPRVRERVRKMHDPAILSSDWICYAMMYAPPSQPI